MTEEQETDPVSPVFGRCETQRVPTKKPDGTLQELLKLFPNAVWATEITGTTMSYTTAELLAGASGIRLTRRLHFDGQYLYAGRTGVKTRSPLFRLIRAS